MKAGELLILWEKLRQPMSLKWQIQFLQHPDIEDILVFSYEQVESAIKRVDKLSDLLDVLRKDYGGVLITGQPTSEINSFKQVHTSTPHQTKEPGSRPSLTRVCPRCKNDAEYQNGPGTTYYGFYLCYQCYKPVL